jgi:hypothetical protein
VKKRVFLIFFASCFCFMQRQDAAWGDPQAGAGLESQAQSQKSPKEVKESSHDTSADPHSSKKKKSVPREKDAEGTQAPNRFDQDLIIKSRYELNGQSLEVDAD